MKRARIYQNMPLVSGREYSLETDASHYLAKVLRLGKGREIEIFNGDGKNWRARIVSMKKQCRVEIIEMRENLSESKLDLTLAQSLIKNDKMDFVIQKAVELGVKKIIPVIAERSVVRVSGNIEKRLRHWQKIIEGALAQSGRSVIVPIFPPTSLADFLAENPSGFVLAPESQKNFAAYRPKKTVKILVGPEGGFSAVEKNIIQNYDYIRVSLGSRILRAETAGLAALAQLEILANK